MIAGDGDDLPVSALPVDGTFPTRHHAVGKTQHRRSRFRYGTRSCASSAASACWFARTRSSAPRSTTSRTWKARRRLSRCRAGALEGMQGRASTRSRWRPKIAPAAAVRRGLPGQEQERCRSTRPSTWCRRRRCASAKRANWDFFLQHSRIGSATSAQLGTGEGRAAAAAAVRILGRLRRLRRNAVPQAADAALRRSRADRQRHRLLVHLWRQSADDALCTNEEARTGWSNSLFEDNAEFGLGMRLRSDKQNEYARELVAAARDGSSAMNWSTAF